MTEHTAHPLRVQRSRKKGSKLPVGCVCVTRPGKFGNPFGTAEEFARAVTYCSKLRRVPDWMDFEKGQKVLWIIEHIGELRGKVLGCWCSLSKACHADILAEMANRRL